MAKILMLVSGTGGTQMFLKLKEYLDSVGIASMLISVSPIMKQINVGIAQVNSLEEFKQIAVEYKTDYIFTETSNINELMNEACNCYKGRIPIISFQDVWDFDGTRYIHFMPDLICVPTQTTMTYLKELGFTNLFQYTNPAFLDLGNIYSHKSCNLENPKMLYLSQCYNSRKYMNAFIDSIEALISNPNLHIQLHPTETGIVTKYPTFKSTELPLSYDLILGHQSTVQLKTLALGIPTIFYDKNYKQNLVNFMEGKDLITQPLYEEFKHCIDEDYFIERTEALLNHLNISVKVSTATNIDAMICSWKC